MFTRTSTSTNPKSRQPSAPIRLFFARGHCGGAVAFSFDVESPAKGWRESLVRRRLGAMGEANFTGISDGKNGWMRVLGIDPAAAGPTGFGIVESDGRRCRMLHYGALKVTLKRQRECGGAALQDIHDRVCCLLKEFSPDDMAMEGGVTSVN